jgi:hypothetical protein
VLGEVIHRLGYGKESHEVFGVGCEPIVDGSEGSRKKVLGLVGGIAGGGKRLDSTAARGTGEQMPQEGECKGEFPDVGSIGEIGCRYAEYSKEVSCPL